MLMRLGLIVFFVFSFLYFKPAMLLLSIDPGLINFGWVLFHVDGEFGELQRIQGGTCAFERDGFKAKDPVGVLMLANRFAEYLVDKHIFECLIADDRTHPFVLVIEQNSRELDTIFMPTALVSAFASQLLQLDVFLVQPTSVLAYAVNKLGLKYPRNANGTKLSQIKRRKAKKEWTMEWADCDHSPDEADATLNAHYVLHSGKAIPYQMRRSNPFAFNNNTNDAVHLDKNPAGPEQSVGGHQVQHGGPVAPLDHRVVGDGPDGAAPGGAGDPQSTDGGCVRQRFQQLRLPAPDPAVSELWSDA